MKEIYKTFFATADEPGLGPEMRDRVEPLKALNASLDQAFGKSRGGELSRAVVLLWHDHLDAAHQIAQKYEDPDGSFVHAIMHRREPDYGNSMYWFRRVGDHPVYQLLAGKAAEHLASPEGKKLREKILPNGKWDPFAFVDLCEQLADRPHADQMRLARSIQAAELRLLVEHLLQVNLWREPL